MHWQLLLASVVLVGGAMSMPAVGQDATVAAASECAASLTIPALTPVRLELLAPLGSKISRSGDSFPIRLAEPIVVEGVVLVREGTTGMGEVVHAKKAGGSGSAGELVLAARYLEVCGQRLRLRSMHLSSNGKSRTDTVNALNVASAASPLPVGLFGFMIHGGQVNVPQGTIAEAKTAEIFPPAATADARQVP